MLQGYVTVLWGATEKMFKTVAVLGVVSAFLGDSAHAVTPNGPQFIAMHLGDDGYGLVVNTDAGTFDAAVLAKAVREDSDAKLVRVVRSAQRRGRLGAQ